VQSEILVGDFRVQYQLNTIVGGEGPIKVEPRVMQVLVALARKAGEVVPKEDLIRDVWGEVFVSDDVLTNSIWELRRALGDSARRPSFIQTVSKRGYRLIAPVRFVGNGPGAPVEREREAPARRLGAQRIPLWVPLALAVAALAFAGTSVHFLLPPATAPLPDPAVFPARAVAVLYFENHSGDPSLDWLRLGLTEMMVTDLSQSSGLRVLSTERVEQVVKELGPGETTSLEVARRLAETAEVDTVILGSFSRAGQAIRISVRMQDARSGEILASEKIEGETKSIFTLVDELARRLKTRLEIRGTAEARLDRNLREVTTRSLPAYRLYVAGLERYLHYFDLKGAVDLLSQAVEMDPEFALTLSRLSVLSVNLGREREAELYARRAMEHVQRLAARERSYIEGNYYSLGEETVDRAIEAYRKALELFPDHAAARTTGPATATSPFTSCAGRGWKKRPRHSGRRSRSGRRASI
jgi:DNA-binding winged helix-turn-helix (wHTH) protein/TolB-like protein